MPAAIRGIGKGKGGAPKPQAESNSSSLGLRISELHSWKSPKPELAPCLVMALGLQSPP